MKHESGEKIMGDFDALRPKAYSHLTDDTDENKKKQRAQKRIS